MYTSIELFAGAGGLAFGVEKAGFNTLGLIEFDKDAADTLKKNRPNWNVINDDIANISCLDLEKYFSIKKGELDLLSGGAPCQAFSYAGKRLGLEDARGTLFYHYALFLEKLQPKMFLFENVQGLLTHDHGKTYMKMQNQLLNDDDCACFLVEAIAQKSQNVTWNPTVDGKKISHKRIRRVSIDQFYALVTGEEDAFYQMCMVLPEVIKSVVAKGGDVKVPHDTVAEELKKIAEISGEKSENLAMALAVYMLGFSSYIGFSKLVDEKEDIDENFLNRIYAYARGIGF